MQCPFKSILARLVNPRRLTGKIPSLEYRNIVLEENTLDDMFEARRNPWNYHICRPGTRDQSPLVLNQE